MSKIMRFESQITDIHESNNPEFSLCRILVCYTGDNRNKSSISKEVIEDAIPSIYNIPIIGNFIESDDNFGGHDGKIEITNKGIKYTDLTTPLGLVSESSDVHFEMITDDDDIEREWLVVDDAILWTGRYSQQLDIFNEYSLGQSMELNISDGNTNEDGIYNIEKFTFSGLCILGIDKGDTPEQAVEPCFENASISLYAFNQDSFMKEYSKMVEEVKNSSKIEWPKVSGKELKKQVKDKPNSGEFSWTSEQLEDELRMLLSSQKYTSDWGYQYSAYWLVDYLPDQNIVIAEDSQNYYLVGMNYTVDGDKVSIDFESCKRFKIEYVPMALEDDDVLDNSQTFNLVTKEHMEYEVQKKLSEKFAAQGNQLNDDVNNDVNSEDADTGNNIPVDGTKNTPLNQDQAMGDDFALELEELKTKYAALEEENKQLSEYKSTKEQEERTNAETELFTKFSDKLTEEEVKDVKEHASEFSLEELEVKLFALVGKKAASGQFSLTNKKPEGNKMPVFTDKTENAPYGGLVEKYAQNK